jgi:hypothetical protein
MSDAPTPAPFSFKTARPARQVKTERVEDMPEVVRDPDGHEVGPVKRKRRTRAEIEASAGTPTPAGELAVLKVCLKQLRSLDDQARTRVLLLLKAVFE